MLLSKNIYRLLINQKPFSFLCNVKSLPSYICFIIISFILSGCDEPSVPHQHGYLRIELPAHSYQAFDPVSCPFRFEIAKLAEAVPDTNRLSETCWWYINYPSMNGKVYISYKSIHNDFNKFAEDARTLVYKHTQRANAINEDLISNDYHASGILYDIGGDAASSIQFFMTDSTKHFLRGALYFNSVPNSDSLAPYISYIKADVEHMLATLQWK